MRYFLKGFLYGILGISLIGLIWLMIVRPQLTARDAALLTDAYSETVSGATSPGDSVGEESSVNILAMQRQYPDIKAWLTVPGTVIDYPVLQSSADDPEHYLRRNYDDTWRMAGSLFFQYDCTLDSRNLVIFGHNMSDGSMFACLRNMFDAEFREEHSQIILHTADSTRYFRVVSAMKTDLTQLPFNQTMFQSDNDFLTFAEQMLQDTDAMPNSDLTLLTLITCAYDWDGARTVVVAVETNEW